MSVSVRQKIVFGFGAAIAALLAVFGTAFLSLQHLQTSHEWVSHSFNVIAHIHLIDSDLQEAQAGSRGYMLSQQPEFLDLAKSRLLFVKGEASATARLTADNPVQRENFLRLMPLLEQSIGRIQNKVRLCSAGRVNDARKLFRLEGSGSANQALEKIIGQMLSEEETLLSARERRLADQSLFTLWVLVFSFSFFLVLFIVGLWVINQEIKRKDRIQEYLQAEEKRLFQYLEAVPLGILIAKKSGVPYYANIRAKKLLGQGLLPNSPLEKQSEIYQLFRAGTQEIYPTAQLPLIRAMSGEKTVTEDMEIHQPDGTIIPLQVWGTPVVDEAGKIEYAMVVFEDIAERKKVEEMKHNLISVVSHQLKTPVGEINGYIENLLDGIAGELGEKQADYLLDMREIGLDNYRLISDLLSLSKIERGLLKVDLQKVSLPETVKMALRDYEKIIRRKGLALTLEGFDQRLDVMADQDKLVETLRNIVNNALKFTDKGGIHLKAEKAGPFVLIKIQDTGSGISEAVLAQLFTPNKILGTESFQAGAGLGLYIAKTFMKLQGGDITVQSEKGKGSCFTISVLKA